MEKEQEFFIAFYTKEGGLDAVRVRIDTLRIKDMNAQMDIGLCDHPLYKELQQYVLGNLRP